MTGYPAAPRDLPADNWEGARNFARQIAAVVNRSLQGKLNAVYGDFTLTANAGATVLTDARLSVNSWLGFMPLTAHAAAELAGGALHVAPADMNNGACTIRHANNAQTDRIFRLLIIG